MRSKHHPPPPDGVFLAGIYDASTTSGVRIGTSDQIGSAGFVIAGKGPCKLRIRGVGPGLATFGIAQMLADPLLWLFTAEGKVALGNDIWGTAAGYPLLAQNSTEVGAFPLQDGSKDAALMMQWS